MITFKADAIGTINFIALEGEISLSAAMMSIYKLHDTATIDHLHFIHHILPIEKQPLFCVVVWRCKCVEK